MNKKIQHQLGQHYSKEEELVKRYNSKLKEQKNNIVVDPFCGEGHLIFHYLNLFTYDEQINILKEKKIMGMDIYKKNVEGIKQKLKEKYNLDEKLLSEIFYQNDSFLNITQFDKNTFILTNPPYLAKNVVKKSYIDDFNKYFKEIYSVYNDYFEIALNIYSKYNGLWIVPSNIFSSELMKKTRNKIIDNIDDIVMYKIKTFDSTGISVSTFLIDKKRNDREKTIKFISEKSEKNIDLKIDNQGNLVKEWQDIVSVGNTEKIKQGYIREKINIGEKPAIVLNEKYQQEKINITEEDYNKLKNNILILRTTDTGGKSGKIGLYTINELWNDQESVGLVTKISSRVYVQIFINNLSVEKQLILKDKFNNKLNELREKYDSIFLTNYKNVSNDKQRKRISFKDSFSLMSHIINSEKLNEC